MISKLKPIVYDPELTEFDLSMTEPCDDRLITELHLSDYDWMDYQFVVYLPTKKQGFLTATMKYFGTTTSEMEVKQILDDHTTYLHKIIFPTDIFIDYLKQFMTAHLEQWNTTYAFCGEELAVKFFNAVLSSASAYQVNPFTERIEDD